MRRGRAGGIIRDEASALANQRADGSGLARRFGTSMPNASLPGVEAYGRSVMAQGEALMRFSGDWIARRNAETAPIAQDPETGAWVRPSAPPIMGMRGMQIYEQIVDDRFQTAVQEDTRATLDRIAAENQYDPERAHALMTAHVEGTLGGLDDRWKNRMSPLFQREVSQRHRGILSSQFSRERAMTLRMYENTAQDAMDRAYAAQMLGDPQRAQEEAGRAAHSINQLVEMGHIHPNDAELMMRGIERIDQAGLLLNHVVTGIDDGTMSPDDLLDIARILRQGQGSLHGVIDEEVLRLFPTQQQRDQLAAQVERIASNAVDTHQATQREAAFVAGMQHYAQGNRWRPEALKSDNDFHEFVLHWATEKGYDTSSLDFIDIALDQMGDIPTNMINTWFRNTRNMAPGAMATTRERYERLRENRRLDLIPESERRFMGIYADLVNAGWGDTPDTMERANRLMEMGEARVTEIATYPMRALREAYNHKRGGIGQTTNADVERQLNGALSSAYDGFLSRVPGMRSLPQFNDLSATQKGALMTSLMTELTLLNPVNPGDNWDAALETVVTQFVRAHQPDPFHPSAASANVPLIPREEAVPVLHNPMRNNEPITDHLQDVINRIMPGQQDEQGRPLPSIVGDSGVPIEGWTLGQDVFLKYAGRGDGLFELRHNAGGALRNVGVPVVDTQGNPILIDVGEVNRLENAELQQWAMNEVAPEFRATLMEFLDAAEGDGEMSPELLAAMAEYTQGWDEYRPRSAPDLSQVLHTIPSVEAATGMEPTARQVQDSLQGSTKREIPRVPRDEAPSIFNFPDPPVRPENVGVDGDGPVSGPFTEFTPAVTRKLASLTDRPGRNVQGLDADFQVRLANLFEAMPRHVRSQVRIGSSYRSTEEQAALFARFGPGRAARPGNSNHERGLAVDLRNVHGQARTWVHDNAARFGLHFPYGHEPWHIEPIQTAGDALPWPLNAFPPNRPTGGDADEIAYTLGD